MTQKRLLVLYTAVLCLFAVVVGRLYLLAGNTQYARTAQQQRVTTLELGRRRGNFYDARGQPLTGSSPQYYALSVPGQDSYARLFQYAGPAGQSLLYQRRNAAQPFLVPVDRDLNSEGVYTWSVPCRLLPTPIAPHLLGCLDGEGRGVSGLEAACDDLLARGGPAESIQCVTTARGQLLEELPPAHRVQPGTGLGVQLTLDARIQRLCEGTAQATMTSGCILVLESATGKVRACVSMPTFDPAHLQKSLDSGDAALLNRALYPFNAGSVFKPVVAAAALERGWHWFTADCKGYVDLNGHIYRCAKSRAHGQVNLRGALEKSCNCYFIELGLKLGGEEVARMARAFGFGQPVWVRGGMQGKAGTLPGPAQLRDLGQLASVSFGQGQLTVTPLQVAAMMNTIAQGGVYTSPSFLEAIVQEPGGQPVQSLYAPQVRRVLRPDTAAALQHMLVSVVEEGIGRQAAPTTGGAGGKTGTAQTGQLAPSGAERMNFWFAGFYPAIRPEYTVVVLQDGQTDPPVSSAAIFARVCTGISYLEDG